MTSRPRLPAAPYPKFDGSQACAKFPFTTFFPGPGSHPREWTQAKAICFDCPFRTACVAFSLTHMVQGVWGGMTGPERESIRAAMGVTASPVVVGDQKIVHERIDALAVDGVLTSSEIAIRAGCSAATVQRHLRRRRNEAA
jgi:hypothetical protein